MKTTEKIPLDDVLEIARRYMRSAPPWERARRGNELLTQFPYHMNAIIEFVSRNYPGMKTVNAGRH